MDTARPLSHTKGDGGMGGFKSSARLTVRIGNVVSALRSVLTQAANLSPGGGIKLFKLLLMPSLHDQNQIGMGAHPASNLLGSVT